MSRIVVESDLPTQRIVRAQLMMQQRVVIVQTQVPATHRVVMQTDTNIGAQGPAGPPGPAAIFNWQNTDW